MKKRYIFEVDDTLLTGSKKDVQNFFEQKFGDKAPIIMNSMGENIARYEKIFASYDFELLSGFLTMRTGLEITPEIVREWAYVLSETLSFKEEQVVELLENLKHNDKSLAVLTNWFGVSQIARLKKAGLYDYFDEIYTGDIVMKPKQQAYKTALGRFSPEESVVIGPSLDNDYIGPRANGITSILYDKNDVYHKSVMKVKRMDEILKIK